MVIVGHVLLTIYRAGGRVGCAVRRSVQMILLKAHDGGVHDPGFAYSVGHDDELNFLPRGYLNALSNPGSIYSRINVTRITRVSKTFYFEHFGLLKPFQPGYKLYEGKNVFLIFYIIIYNKCASDTRVCTAT